MSGTVPNSICAVVALFCHGTELISSWTEESIMLSVVPWILSAAAAGCITVPPRGLAKEAATVSKCFVVEVRDLLEVSLFKMLS